MKYIIITLAMAFSGYTYAQKEFETDTFQTSSGNLSITFIGHGTLMFTWNGKTIHVDPVQSEADYTKLPKADIILVTHEHQDHFDPATIHKLMKSDTKIVMPEACYENLGDHAGAAIKVMNNGDALDIDGVKIKAIPAYNIEHMRPDGSPFHPKGRGNGYVLQFGGKKVLVAGDTENIPEIKALKNIDIAFLPMNLPYTMTPEMVADAARAFKPAILYPYHFGSTDTDELLKLMKNVDGVEVRIKKMK